MKMKNLRLSKSFVVFIACKETIVHSRGSAQETQNGLMYNAFVLAN